MPPVARTPAQRGPFGRWLTEAREARYRRQTDALEAMRRLAGLHISPSEFAQWEAGSRVPRPDNPKVERLYEFFGSRPQEETGPALGEAGLGALVEALHAHPPAINALVTELREDRRLGSEVRERVAESAAFLVERELRRQAGRPQGDETPEDEQSGSAPLPAAR